MLLLQCSLLQAITSDETKKRLIDTTQEALDRGAFGAPTIFVNDDMYFGCDRFPLIARQLGMPWTGPFPDDVYTQDIQQIVSGKAKL